MCAIFPFENWSLKCSSYEKLDHAVNNCPDTWTAALFLTLLQRVIELGIFNDVTEVVAKVERRILKEHNEAETQQTTGKGLNG